MVIKDRIIEWYLRKIYLPRSEIIDRAGFICEHVGEQRSIFLREIAIPENIISELEKKIKNKKALYCIGKKFGYRYSLISKFSTLRDSEKNKFLEDVNLLVRYVQSISYGKRMAHDIDYERKLFTLNMNDYIICRKNGNGYVFSSGGIAGIWAYKINDPSAEGIQTACQGRGDKQCEVVCGPRAELKKKNLNFETCDDINDMKLGKSYARINRIRQCQFSTNSLKRLIDSDFFDYHFGLISHKNERFFLTEASFMYILEKELKKVKGGLDTLFKVSFEWGEKTAKKEKKQSPTKFISDLFPALGWGDVLAFSEGKKYSVRFTYFPWTKWAKEISFVQIRGMLSGIISGFIGKKVLLKTVKPTLSGDTFTLIMKS